MSQKYGLPIAGTYLVKPGVAASVSFGASGHVCETVVSPDEHASVKRLQTFRQELTDVIDELVPVNERGKPIGGGFSMPPVCPTTPAPGLPLTARKSQST